MKDHARLFDLAKSHQKVFIMCRRGVDSKDLTDHLLNAIASAEASDIPCNFVNVEGGICEWSRKIDASIPYY